MKKAVVLISGMLIISGCFATREEMQTLQEDIATLQGQVSTLQKATNQSTSKIKIGQADIGARMDEVELSQQQLTAKIEETNGRIEKLGLRLDDLEELFKARLKALESNTTAEFTVSADTLYQTAYADFTRGNFDLAILGFREYLNKYPLGTLADSAQFWIGQCFVSQKKYQEAIVEFAKVSANFSQSKSAPAAKYKIALAQIELDQKEEALKTLDELILKYPEAQERKLAQDKKQELSK